MLFEDATVSVCRPCFRPFLPALLSTPETSLLPICLLPLLLLSSFSFKPSSSSHLSVCKVSYMCEPPVCRLHTREEERKGAGRDEGKLLSSLTPTLAGRKQAWGLLIKSASGWLATNTSTFLRVQPRLRCCRRGRSGWSYWSAPSYMLLKVNN